jgi:Phage integrase family
MINRAGQKISIPFQVHSHMLRHAAGYKLAGDGHDTRSIQDYLGHKNIQQTVRYTELSPIPKFKDFPYQIIKRMPTEDGEFKYRIKSPREPHERIAKESDLRSLALA